MRLALVLLVASCVDPVSVPDHLPGPDAAIPPVPMASAYDLVPCGASWDGAVNAPLPGVMCERGCADYAAIGAGGSPCRNAKHVGAENGVLTFSLVSCTAATSTLFAGQWLGCCEIAPDFAYDPSTPPRFAVCDEY